MHHKAKAISLKTSVLISVVKTLAAALEANHTCTGLKNFFFNSPAVLVKIQTPLKPQTQLPFHSEPLQKVLFTSRTKSQKTDEHTILERSQSRKFSGRARVRAAHEAFS